MTWMTEDLHKQTDRVLLTHYTLGTVTKPVEKKKTGYLFLRFCSPACLVSVNADWLLLSVSWFSSSFNYPARHLKPDYMSQSVAALGLTTSKGSIRVFDITCTGLCSTQGRTPVLLSVFLSHIDASTVDIRSVPPTTACCHTLVHGV